MNIVASVLSTFHNLSHLIIMAIPKMHTIMVFILELRKLKHSEVSNMPKTP